MEAEKIESQRPPQTDVSQIFFFIKRSVGGFREVVMFRRAAQIHRRTVELQLRPGALPRPQTVTETYLVTAFALRIGQSCSHREQFRSFIIPAWQSGGIKLHRRSGTGAQNRPVSTAQLPVDLTFAGNFSGTEKSAAVKVAVSILNTAGTGKLQSAPAADPAAHPLIAAHRQTDMLTVCLTFTVENPVKIRYRNHHRVDSVEIHQFSQVTICRGGVTGIDCGDFAVAVNRTAPDRRSERQHHSARQSSGGEAEIFTVISGADQIGHGSIRSDLPHRKCQRPEAGIGFGTAVKRVALCQQFRMIVPITRHRHLSGENLFIRQWRIRRKILRQQNKIPAARQIDFSGETVNTGQFQNILFLRRLRNIDRTGKSAADNISDTAPQTVHFFRRAENDFSGRRLRCGDDQRIFAVDRDPDQVSGDRHRNAGVDTLRQHGVMKKLTVAGDHAQGSEIFQLQHEISADRGDHGTFGVFAVGVEFKCQFSCRLREIPRGQLFTVLETVSFFTF